LYSKRGFPFTGFCLPAGQHRVCAFRPLRGFYSLPRKSKNGVADFLSLAWAWSLTREFRFVLRYLGVSGAFWVRLGFIWHAKTTSFATFQKVMSLVFKYSLASFALFLYFLPRLRISTSRAVPNPDAFPRLSPQPETCATSKSSNCASNLRIMQSIWVHFRFVLGFVFDRSSFVFKDSLASFPLFFIFSTSRLSARAGTFPPFVALG